MAGDYIITGGRPLNGTVRVPAAKNSVLPLLAASLLCSGPVRLCGVPEPMAYRLWMVWWPSPLSLIHI